MGNFEGIAMLVLTLATGFMILCYEDKSAQLVKAQQTLSSCQSALTSQNDAISELKQQTDDTQKHILVVEKQNSELQSKQQKISSYIINVPEIKDCVAAVAWSAKKSCEIATAWNMA